MVLASVTVKVVPTAPFAALKLKHEAPETTKNLFNSSFRFATGFCMTPSNFVSLDTYPFACPERDYNHQPGLNANKGCWIVLASQNNLIRSLTGVDLEMIALPTCSIGLTWSRGQRAGVGVIGEIDPCAAVSHNYYSGYWYSRLMIAYHLEIKPSCRP